MFLTFITALVSLLLLVVLHELGHFILARRFGILVEEFGIGLPPRIWGKKVGETIYSFNWLPLGAFVKLYGEEERKPGVQSFSEKPVWQRFLIVFAGVATFWIVATILFSFLMALGAPTVINDSDTSTKNTKVQIAAAAAGSPAEAAGLNPGDTIKEMRYGSEILQPTKLKEVQDFTESHKGEQIVLKIQRGRNIFEISLTPRAKSPNGEGPMGVALVRTDLKSYPWFEAPWRGILATLDTTFDVADGWIKIFSYLFENGSLPQGAQVVGPIGIFSLFNQASEMGINYYLQFIAMISVYLALFNILPIPAVDGGKIAFLIIEAIRRKALPRLIEQRITAAFFLLLISLLIFVTIKDIARII